MAKTGNKNRGRAVSQTPKRKNRRRRPKNALPAARKPVNNNKMTQSLITDVLTMLQDESIQPSEASYQIDLFNDLDLAVLGSSPEDYEKYSQSLQKEYGTDSYRKDRLKMLKTLLLIPSIYSTELLRERFEASARRNIQKEIEDSQN